MRILKKVALIINLLFIALLCGSYLAGVIDPADALWLAFLGLAYPGLLVINMLFVIFWLFFRKWYFILSLVTIFSGWTALAGFIRLPGFKGETSTGGTKIMTYNVLNFNLYDGDSKYQSRKEMLHMIRQENPDIVCFQEFYSEDFGSFNNIPIIQEELGLPFYHFLKTVRLREKDNWGIALFSKHPILLSQEVNFPGSSHNACFFSDIEIDGKRIRIFNVHLQSIYFNTEDYAYFEQIAANQNTDETATKRVLKKLETAWTKRSEQAAIVSDVVKRSPHPVILCGDFNDLPTSYTYQRISDGLNDAFKQAGKGISSTYAGNLPALRIDYILGDKRFEFLEYRTINKKISDHYPVLARFRL